MPLGPKRARGALANGGGIDSLATTGKGVASASPLPTPLRYYAIPPQQLTGQDRTDRANVLVSVILKRSQRSYFSNRRFLALLRDDSTFLGFRL